MQKTPILYISAKSDGHLGVSALGNRKKYFKKLGINEKQIVDIVVAHGDQILTATGKDGEKFFEGFDAVVTKNRNITLGMTVADCLPIAIFDPVKNYIALVHAGWKSLEKNVIGKTIEKLSTENSKLEVYIGPHICQKHYEVKSDVSDKFAKYRKAVLKAGTRQFLDLGKVAETQLIQSGVKKKNINADPRCTFEDGALFSFRRGDFHDRNLYLLTFTEDASTR